MTAKPIQLYPEPLEGLPFPLRDLCSALNWADAHPGVQVRIMLDHPWINEVIEIQPPGSSSLRWLIWRTHEGRLRVDDLAKAEFGLPYLTVATALQFIATEL